MIIHTNPGWCKLQAELLKAMPNHAADIRRVIADMAARAADSPTRKEALARMAMGLNEVAP